MARQFANSDLGTISLVGQDFDQVLNSKTILQEKALAAKPQQKILEQSAYNLSKKLKLDKRLSLSK